MQATSKMTATKRCSKSKSARNQRLKKGNNDQPMLGRLNQYFHTPSTILRLTIALALIGLAHTPAMAATRTWVGQPFLPGNWSSSGFLINNWEGFPPTLPSDGDSLVFGYSFNLSTTNDLLSRVEDITFAAGAGAYTIGGSPLLVTGRLQNNSNSLQTIDLPISLGGSFQQWDGGIAGLTLRGGLEMNNRNLTLLRNININADAFVVGRNGTANLILSNNSKLNARSVTLAAGSVSDIGIVSVNGTGSSLTTTQTLTVGLAGKGTLDVRDGGKATLERMVLGDMAGSSGIVTVNGSQSRLNLLSKTQSSVVGRQGSGSLQIESGGQVEGYVLKIGGQGSVIVDGNGSQLSSLVELNEAGASTLSLRNGGKFTGSVLTGLSTGSATVLVDGAGSEFKGQVSLYGTGNSQLVVRNGGTTLLNGLGISGTNSSATVSGAGSKIDTTQASGAGAIPIISLMGGTLDVLNGGTVNSKQLSGSSGNLQVDGAGSSWVNDGRLFMGLGGKVNLRISNGSVVTTGIGSLGGYNNGTAWNPLFWVPVLDGGFGEGTMQVTGIGSRWLSERLNIGEFGNGSLEISRGGLVRSESLGLGITNFDDRGKGGSNFHSRGTVLVDGVGSLLDASSIAISGKSSLTVTNGAKVSGAILTLGTVLDGQSFVLVDGAGSSIDLTARKMGSINVKGSLYIGSDTGSTKLEIRNGGKVNAEQGSLGHQAASSVLIDGAGSSLRFSDGLKIGSQNSKIGSESFNSDHATSHVQITRGASLISGDSTVGAVFNEYTVDGKSIRSFDSGQVTIDGRGSSWKVNGTLSLGPAGFGKVQVNEGRLEVGTLAVGKRGTIELQRGSLIASGAAHTNSGDIVLQRGEMQMSGETTNEALGRIVINDASNLARFRDGLTNKGQLLVNSGSASIFGNITTQDGGQISLNGNSYTTFNDMVDVKSGGELHVSDDSTAVFRGQVFQRTGAQFTGGGNKFYEGGLSVGNSPGLGVDAGNVSFGSLNEYLAEIAGTALGNATGDGLAFDRYIVNGQLSLGGTLKLVSYNNFIAQDGQSFDLFDWGSLTGRFDQIDVSGFHLASGAELDFSMLYVDGTISVTAVPEADTTGMLLAGLGITVAVLRRRQVG